MTEESLEGGCVLLVDPGVVRRAIWDLARHSEWDAEVERVAES
jgi:hypothetical protein